MTPWFNGAMFVIHGEAVAILLVVVFWFQPREPVVWAVLIGALAISQMLANVGSQIVKAIRGEAS